MKKHIIMLRARTVALSRGSSSFIDFSKYIIEQISPRMIIANGAIAKNKAISTPPYFFCGISYDKKYREDFTSPCILHPEPSWQCVMCSSFQEAGIEKTLRIPLL